MSSFVFKCGNKTSQPFNIIWDTNIEIAGCLEEVGEYDVAIRKYTDLYGRCKEEYGDEHAYTLTTMCNLANCMKEQGKYTEARSLYEEVYNIAKRELSEDRRMT